MFRAQSHRWWLVVGCSLLLSACSASGVSSSSSSTSDDSGGASAPTAGGGTLIPIELPSNMTIVDLPRATSPVVSLTDANMSRARVSKTSTTDYAPLSWKDAADQSPRQGASQAGCFATTYTSQMLAGFSQSDAILCSLQSLLAERWQRAPFAWILRRGR